jgi:hypothetical protein
MAKKKIITVGGVANVGKTTTLKLVRDELLKRPGAVLEKVFVNKRDIKLIIKVDGLLVGIESAGDPTGRVETEQLRDFIAAGCDVIVCATRTRGRAYDVPKLYADTHDVVRFEKTWEFEDARATANAEFAKKIVAGVLMTKVG